MHNIELVRNALAAYEYHLDIGARVIAHILHTYFHQDFEVVRSRVYKAKHKIRTQGIIAHDRVLTGRNV